MLSGAAAGSGDAEFALGLVACFCALGVAAWGAEGLAGRAPATYARAS